MREKCTILFALVALSATAFGQSSSESPYRVIVHPQITTGNVDRKFLADAFLKKITQWPNGETIHPVDQITDSPVRRRFTSEVLIRPVAAVKNYWQQMIFSGRDVPPPELDSDDAVVTYVVKHNGAVGYVSGGAKIGDAKVLNIR